MPISLPEVTLVAIDCKAHDLTRAALTSTLEHIIPGDIQIWSDRRLIPEGEWHKCDLQSYDAVASMLWNFVPFKVKTTHVLLIQWDGWVTDATAWDPEWLNCDYVGAPWWYTDGMNVGNGGFSLRSRELLRWLSKHPNHFPVRNPEDDTLCRRYRPRLESSGFRWATQPQARRFAFESAYAAPTFGFHAVFNWHHVFSIPELEARMSLANDYVRGKVEWPQALAFLAKARLSLEAA